MINLLVAMVIGVPPQAPPVIRPYEQVMDNDFLIVFFKSLPVGTPNKIGGAIVCYKLNSDTFKENQVVISGRWKKQAQAIYTVLTNPTMQEIKTALAKAQQKYKVEGQIVIPKSLALSFEDRAKIVDGDSIEVSSLLKGMIPYKRAKFTQSIVVENDRDKISKVSRNNLESKWHQSGGMLGLDFQSDVYLNPIAATPDIWVGNIGVLNSDGFIQQNRGYKLLFHNDSKFMDVLSHNGKVFELRQREKTNGKWASSILFESAKHRPRGYVGLTVSCNSCHNQAGTGGYGSGLVPGGDGVLSYPIPALEE